MADTVLDGSGEQIPGRRPLEGTDLEIAYNLLGDALRDILDPRLRQA